MNYYLSKKGDNKYEVRVLSNTNNPNVIFQLSIRNNEAIGIYDLELFSSLIMEQLKEN